LLWTHYCSAKRLNVPFQMNWVRFI
jgi:hypothetical protein